MPGNLASASPSGIFPQTLSLAFEEDRSFLQLENWYKDGTRQCSQLTTTSRKIFRLAKKLLAADLATLKALWIANGNTQPLSFYNPFEPASGQAIGSNYDPSGASTQGRYTVVFQNVTWSQSGGIARANIPDVQLREVA